MKKTIILVLVLISLLFSGISIALSINAPFPKDNGGLHLVVDTPYKVYDALLMVGPEYSPPGAVPYTLVIDEIEYLITVDNPNVLPLLWGLREGEYSVRIIGYLTKEDGHFPNPMAEFDVAHVEAFIFE